MLAGVTAAVAVLIVFLMKWNTNLNNEVKRRTKDLESANEQLKFHDKMQKEFINIAAHELRTPIQPILGLSQIILPRLFSKFVSKSFSGTGLGLFIAKSIIESHNGKIWAENNIDGKGAKFSFTLPIADK